MPDEMSVLSIAKNYNGEKSDISDMVAEDLNNPNLVNLYNEMLNNCFYFNDGKSTQRAVDFIRKIK